MSQHLAVVSLWTGLLLVLHPSAHGETPRRDRYGDPLPAAAIARLGTTRLRHFGRVFDVTFSPDGTLLASVGEDRRLRVWEAATGRQVRQLPGYGHVAFSPNGKMLASYGGDGSIRLWNVATGQPVGKPIRAYPGFLGFAPDSSTLALIKVVNPSPSRAPTEQAIALWEIATARVIRSWTIKASVYAATFSPDGKALAIGTNEWTSSQTKETHGRGKGTPGHTIGVLSLWETATGKERWRSAQRMDAILSVAFSPDGKSLVSAGEYLDPATNERHGTITFWDAATGKKLRKLPDLVNRVECVRISADGRYLASICGQGPTILWDLKAARGPRRLWQVPDNGYRVTFSPDGHRFAWCSRQAIRMLDLPPRKEHDPRGGHAGSWPLASASIPFVAFTSDGKTVVSVGDRVRLWNADTGVELRASPEFLMDCSAAALSLQGKTLVTGSRASTTLWDLETLKPLRTFATPHDSVRAMALSADGKTLATSLEHTVVVGEETERLPVGARRLETMVRLWDVKTGKEKRPIDKGAHVAQLAFSPDGRRLACTMRHQQGDIRVWDTKSGEVSLDVKSRLRRGPGQAFCFSPDGKLLASVEEDQTIRLWDAHSGGSVRALRGPPGPVFILVFSADGKTLLSAGDDDLLRLWDVASGKMLHELAGHESAVVAAAFSPDGKRIVSASQDTTLLIWDVVGLAKRVQPPPPPLTEEELQCLWSDLGARDYYLSPGAIRRVRTAPRTTVAFLSERLKPDLPRDNRLARLLDDLDSDSFSEREKASRELAGMAKSVGPLLKRALAEEISPEKRRRLQALVAALPRPQRPRHDITAEERRLLNTVVLLDRIGTAEALDLLHYLSRTSELSALLSDRSVWQGELREVKAALARRAKDSIKPGEGR